MPILDTNEDLFAASKGKWMPAVFEEAVHYGKIYKIDCYLFYGAFNFRNFKSLH
jgi:hypothetical protein